MTGESLLLLAWTLYFGLHSLLAADGVKRRLSAKLPRLASCYRLGYNLVALITLLPIIWIHTAYPAHMLWQWQGAASVVAQGFTLAALLGFAWSLKYYDMAAFSGIRAGLRRDAEKTQDSFTLSPLHRHVRHPWYLFALIILWSRDQNSLTLISSVMISVYLFLGSRLEERKLLRAFGRRYGDYMARVPGIIPLPWRRLSAAEARALTRRSPPAADADRWSG